MDSNLPNYTQLSHQAGAVQVNKVLHALFARERSANLSDDEEYGKMIQEIQSRVQHRRAIMMELQQFGYHRAINEPLKALLLAEREDLDEIDLLIERRKASVRRATEKSKIMKMLRNYK